jgi:1,4-alpha-glucan branching enzyme
MQKLDDQFHLLNDKLIEKLYVHEENKQLVFRRGPLVFVFNFHPTNSYSDWRIPVPDPSSYQVVLNTDNKRFEGPGLCAIDQTYPVQKKPWDGREQSLQVYVPARSAQVLAPM